jgi:nitric oxide reductase NorE protein
VVFTGIKLFEYVHVFELGVTLSTNTFWFSYLFLTAIHLLHLFVGIGVLGWLAATYHQPQSPEHAETIEAAAVYWHMVDLIWIVLFPALYLVHP